MPMRVTMKAVAAAAGVSASTVCRALGSSPQIPADTRARVRKIAARLGYRPDPLLSALAAQRRGRREGSEVATIAYVTGFPTGDEWRRNAFYGPMFKGAEAQALRNGYHLEHFWMRAPGMSGPRLSRILANRGIVGVCVAPIPAMRGRLELDWPRFSAVTMGYSVVRPNLHRTTPHHFHAILAAIRKLALLGYVRIGFCLYAGTSDRVDHLWLAGALLAQKLHPHLFVGVFLFGDDTLARIPEWAKEQNIGVVLSDNQLALAELRRAGISVPGEVDYATLNWTAQEPEIAGVNQRPDAVGAAAVDLVIAQLRRGERGVPEIPVTTMVEGKWVAGSSVRARRRR